VGENECDHVMNNFVDKRLYLKDVLEEELHQQQTKGNTIYLVYQVLTVSDLLITHRCRQDLHSGRTINRLLIYFLFISRV